MAEAATADSSPALLSEAVAQLNTTERAHWKLTGELPSSKDDTSRTPNADPSPASPAEPAAETAATPSADSEPAPSNKKRGNADTRRAELQADIDALLKRRAALREEVGRTAPPATPSGSDAKAAASSPAPEKPTLADLLRAPDVTKPMMTDRQFFDAYPDAGLHEMNAYITRYVLLQDRADAERRASLESAQSRYRTHYEKATQADPDLPSKLPARFLNASPVIQETSGPLNFAAREIQDSEHGDAILGYLGEHPEEIDRLDTLPDPAAVIRAIARLEARITSSTSTQPTPAKRGISAAPAPTTSLGRRATAPADESLAAVADGDVRRFIDVENRRELARKHFRA